MTTLSTHVLDTSLGRPAAGVRIILEGDGEQLAEAVTDRTAAPRISAARWPRGPTACASTPVATSPRRGIEGFYPEVLVTFTISGAGHVHVPLLLSPFGYSTYRGS